MSVELKKPWPGAAVLYAGELSNLESLKQMEVHRMEAHIALRVSK